MNNVPDWSKAPGRANFFAVDKTGNGFWYVYKPETHHRGRWQGGRVGYAGEFDGSCFEESVQERGHVYSLMKECPRHGGSYDTSRHERCPCLERLEQPKPTGDGERVVPMVMNDLITRMEKGIAVYDKALSINNGRDALQDAYEEALDLACYLRQLIEERKI